MARRHLILAGLVWAGALLPCVPAFAETLAAAVERAVLNHPEIKARKSGQKAAGAAVEAAVGLSRPRIGISAHGGVYVDPEVVDESYGVAATASQTLYNGGQVKSERERAKADAGAAGSRLEDAALVIGLQAAQAYIEVQRAQRIVQLVKQNVAAVEGLYMLVRLRVETGLGDPSELYQAKARIEATRSQLETAKQQYADAVAMFQTVTGALPARLETTAAPSKAVPANVDEAVRQARGRSPKIMAIRYEALAAEAAVGIAESALKPKLDLELNLKYGNVIKGYDQNEFKNATAMVVFKFDLYDGGTRRARVRRRGISPTPDTRTQRRRLSRSSVKFVLHGMPSGPRGSGWRPSSAKLRRCAKPSTSARSALPPAKARLKPPSTFKIRSQPWKQPISTSNSPAATISTVCWRVRGSSSRHWALT